MPEPEFVLTGTDRNGDGELGAEDLARVAEVLLAGGFVLLPSDTAYSVAAVPFNAEVRNRINVLLDRRDMPVSLAFPAVPATSRWISPDRVAEELLREFCPGPVTVVCTAAPGLPDQLFEQAMASRNRTIGVRVPNSAVERQIAGATAYPITTVAVRDRDGGIATTLPAALAVVRVGLAASGFDRWCAVDGEVRHHDLSTVVEVTSDGQVELNRKGAIPFEEILAVASAARLDVGIQG